jgi:hypothetical protein
VFTSSDSLGCAQIEQQQSVTQLALSVLGVLASLHNVLTVMSLMEKLITCIDQQKMWTEKFVELQIHFSMLHYFYPPLTHTHTLVTLATLTAHFSPFLFVPSVLTEAR